MFEAIQFTSITEFLQMGKFTFHVWSVYGLFTVFVFVNLFLPRVQRRQFIREQRQKSLRDAQLANNTAVDEVRTSAPGEQQ